MRIWHLLFATCVAAVVFAFVRLVGSVAIVTLAGLALVLGAFLLVGFAPTVSSQLRAISQGAAPTSAPSRWLAKAWAWTIGATYAAMTMVAVVGTLTISGFAVVLLIRG